MLQKKFIGINRLNRSYKSDLKNLEEPYVITIMIQISSNLCSRLCEVENVLNKDCSY